MAEKISGYIVLNATSGGSIDNGQRVRFDLSLEGEPSPQTQVFLCDYHVFNSVIQKLIAFAGIASEDRAKHAGQPDSGYYLDKSFPFEATEIEVGRSLKKGRMGLRIKTKQNIPVDISIDENTARDLAQRILRGIGDTPIPDQAKPS